MLLVVIAVLSIVLTFPASPYGWVTQPVWIVLSAVGAVVLPGLAAAGLNRRTLRLFDRYPENPSRGQAALGRGMTVQNGLILVTQLALLLLTDWLAWCDKVCHGWIFLPGFLALTPFVAAIILDWTLLYPSDRAMRQMAIEVHLFRGRPLRRVWSLGEYLSSNLRHQLLFILLPMLLILLARDLILRYDRQLAVATGLEYSGDLILGASALLVALISPEILRRVWSTAPLPNGPLRDRLLVICDKLHMRCREILVWRSGGMIVNAAVMGVVAPLRYVLITDAMLEQLDDLKIEAVFGHEAGHVKRHHIAFFLLFALISGCAVTIYSVHANAAHLHREQYQLAVLGLVLAFKWGVVFGWVSRHFERQADLFGVRTLTVAGLPCLQPCPIHNPLPAAPPLQHPKTALCTTAALIFSHGLHDVAVLNGMRPEARSWRHSSIASRSRHVQRLAANPRLAQRFEQRVFAIKVGIFTLAAITSLWAATEIGLWAAFQRIAARVVS